MLSPGSATPDMCVAKIFALDAKLVQFMMQHQRPDGGFHLEFDGWGKLPKDQQDRLAERLR